MERAYLHPFIPGSSSPARRRPWATRLETNPGGAWYYHDTRADADRWALSWATTFHRNVGIYQLDGCYYRRHATAYPDGCVHPITRY